MRKKYSCTRIFSFNFFLYVWILLSIEIVMAQSTKLPVDVGVVLDADDWIGKIGLSCIKMSLADFYATHPHYKTRIVLHTRDSMKDAVLAAAAAVDLIKNAEVEAIIGPVTSMQAIFVIDVGEKVQVPVISFSASSPSLASIGSPYFFQATPTDSAQVTAISAIVQYFGWREAVPIFVDNEYGIGIIPYLMGALQAVDTRVTYRSAISPIATHNQIVEELHKLKTMQTRVFIVHVCPSLGTLLFTIANEMGMIGEGYVWILTDGMTNFLKSFDASVIDSMQGVLGVKPYVLRTKEIENFRVRWKRKFHRDYPDIDDAVLNIYGLWAYDTTVALAMAIEQVARTSTSFGFNKENDSGGNSIDFETLGVSRNGGKLHQALSSTNFEGLTGDFFFVKRQLQPSAFRIVNVNGNGARTVGFWTQGKGLVKILKSSTANTIDNSSSSTNLAPIIWPGDSTSVPKGWQIPINGNKLRIGVPVKEGFTQLVNVTTIPGSNTTRVEGYSIDLFDAAVAELPYAVTYEYIPFANPDGKSAGTYNDLVYQVYLGNFDAVVGDISIVANRSLYVDYTLPYTGGGRISMIVPTKDDESKKAWIFLKPLTFDLWIISLCFFVFIGFVVWVIEHRINVNFQGSPSQQVGTSCWFSFSTLVFSHQERLVSNLSRTVIVIWCFVALILTQSYTASLYCFLTVEQLQPTVTTIEELLEKGENVGYQKGAFVLGILRTLGFKESKLVPYKSAEECHELLSKGSKNGGIAAAFDESPSTMQIMAQNCSKYTLVEPTFTLQTQYRNNISNIQEFKTDGRGFVFPKGSSLAADLSRAILKVKEGDTIKKIEDKWFGTGKQRSCPDGRNSVSPNTLGLRSFRGLFLIVGAASFLAFLIYIVMFVYQHRGILMTSQSEASFSSRIFDLFKNLL